MTSGGGIEPSVASGWRHFTATFDFAVSLHAVDIDCELSHRSCLLNQFVHQLVTWVTSTYVWDLFEVKVLFNNIKNILLQTLEHLWGHASHVSFMQLFNHELCKRSITSRFRSVTDQIGTEKKGMNITSGDLVSNVPSLMIKAAALQGSGLFKQSRLNKDCIFIE